MGDIQTRPFSKNYSGLINQTVIGLSITVICVTAHEYMKRRRRGKLLDAVGLGSRESWEFGYLYQGRSWARFPSPPSPAGWHLSWIKQVVRFSEDGMHSLRGVDATLYVRFLRACFWFSLLHTLTTFPILFPIHLEFSEAEIPSKSMIRASISSLVATEKGLSLLWIHMCILFWITLSWMATLIWICNGAFRLRTRSIHLAADRKRACYESAGDDDANIYQHPHPQYNFQALVDRSPKPSDHGLRLRSVMVSNVPTPLRDEKELQEYFEYWLSRKVEKPSMGITSSTQPGFLNKSFAFLFNRAKRIPDHLPVILPSSPKDGDPATTGELKTSSTKQTLDPPVIERVVVVRKMTELASLLERREEILRLLETAHIKLANRALAAVKNAMDRKAARKPIQLLPSKAAEIARKRRSTAIDIERGEVREDTLDEFELMDKVVEVLEPFVREFELQRPAKNSKKAIRKLSRETFRRLVQEKSSSSSSSESDDHLRQSYSPSPPGDSSGRRNLVTIWDALLSLPRDALDPYQPLVNLSHLFRGKIVPAIDYYTAKLTLLNSLIAENRSKSITDYDAVSTAFITFADPADARRACKYLAVHPNNPLTCLVTMAPEYQDLDWIRVMKSSFHAEFLKDWIVNVGVWGFTLFWLFPVSLLVGLVSIQNISLFWPSLKRYLDRHPWQSEVIQSFIPTILVASLALLIPLILLLIAKKAHTITTLSALHDLMMTRYYKFLIVNVLVFFCVGTAAMQSALQSFKDVAGTRLIQTIASSFPTAGPFYVGWLIFTTAMHGGFELMLLGLPLLMYPATSRQVTPRKRAVGIRPRTLNYYYWLPNHLLVIHVLLLFSALNPLILPFGTLYFFIQSGVIKNQLIHVYAKNYEGNGKTLLIRILRYSLDGLVLTQVVFLAYMVVLKKTANVGVCAFLIVFTILFKILITRMCRAQFELDDIAEAEILCKQNASEGPQEPEGNPNETEKALDVLQPSQSHASTWKLPDWMKFSYSSLRHHRLEKHRRMPLPFGSVSGFQASRPAPRPDGFPRNSLPSQHFSERPVPIQRSSSGPVVPHPPPLPWDDQEVIDLPYDNPYYSRAVENVLWLPRNPAGILNLDDTVDLKVALTVELSAGHLGTWSGLLESSAPGEMSRTPSHTMNPAITFVSPPVSIKSLPEVDGTEDIDLPVAIKRRLQAGENGIEQTLRPRRSTISRPKLGAGEIPPSTVRSTHSKRRPSILDQAPPPLPSDLNGGYPIALRARTISALSAIHLTPNIHGTLSSDPGFGLRPDAHAQAELIYAMSSNSKTSLAPKAERPQNISTQEAIFHEVLAEEEQALMDRLKDEDAEATKSQSTKSWLTSWMFRKHE